MTIVYAGKKINLLVYLYYSFFLSFFEGKGKKKKLKKTMANRYSEKFKIRTFSLYYINDDRDELRIFYKKNPSKNE